ncbi:MULTISPECIES: hypothetical protein [unclassified Pseudomonas]|uniref:DUF7716 domain-containing protein n=1 Tax=unclassified Pseudomonas TaxID=196821 RepID=UPI002AC9E6D7|nr:MULTISPECIES: hypothetical protein [unclassified Pseudomonas]MEB0048745.1 hypothetical protein [Pseudomonas sp. Dout3]MEB0099035.1 hypothetical protein [Pseudomonas sp. DC1.2]WPX56937.1 hypothetical protein RHM68_14835 [Pseudomonas sp. DC1.2]
MKNRKFSDVLSDAENLDWEYALYLPKDTKKWGLNCEAIIETPDNFEDYDTDDNPVEMSKINYKYVLLCDDLSSIIKNLQEQDRSFDLDMAYKAFIHYFENDDFFKLKP